MIDRVDMKNGKYYVYEHWIDGRCIYVGKGRKERPFQLTFKRNDKWNDIVSKRYDKVVIKVIKEFDTNKDALRYETELTKSYIDNGEELANGRRCGCSVYGKDNPFYGRKHSTETKRKISESNKGKLVGKNNPFYGKKHTPETLAKISVGIRVYCIDLDMEFDSIKAVATYFGVKNRSHITSRIRNNKPYKGLRFVLIDENFYCNLNMNKINK